MIGQRLRAMAMMFAIALGFLVPALAQPAFDFSPANIDRFAEATLGKAYRQGRLSGVGIVAVQNGQTVYRRSFGYADYGHKTPIDPAVTRFRIGSTSKTFTALAIAQLVQQGRIRSLDDPANLYLKRLRLPRMGTRDVTLWDLLTHRGGFEESGWPSDLVSRPLSPADIAKHVPRQNLAAAELANYCNYCVGVLGLVVEDVTGEILQDYLDRHVFRPLGMRDSVLNMSRWPSPNVGKTYRRLPGQPVTLLPFSPIPEFLAPAGAVDTTMDDIARYMIAVLGGPGSEILSRDGWATLLSRHYANHPAANAYGMIWMAFNRNGVEVREHGGTIGGYHTQLSLFPAQKAGIFISCFCAESDVAPKPGALFSLTAYNFHDMIYDHFLGVPPMHALPPGNLDPYVGSYKDEVRNSRWPLRLAGLIAPRVTRVEKVAGGLMIGGKGPYQRVGDDMFRYPGLNGGDLLVPYPNRDTILFLRDAHGGVFRLTPIGSLHPERRLAPLRQPAVERVIAMVATLALALGLTSFFWKRDSALERRGHALLCITAVLGILSPALIITAFLGGWVVSGSTSGEQFRVAAGLAVLPVLTGLASLGCAGLAIAFWREPSAERARIRLATLVALGGGVMSVLFLANA